MRRKSFVVTLLAIMGTVVVVIAAVLGPRWIFSISDAALFEVAHAREEMGNNLSPEGEDSYIVRALWNLRKAKEAAELIGSMSVYPETNNVEYGEKELLAQELLALFMELGQIGVLSPEITGFLCDINLEADCDLYRGVNAYGFEDINIYSNKYQFSLYITREAKSGKVVQLYIWMPRPEGYQNIDLPHAANSLVQYLGLDVMEDWIPKFEDWEQNAKNYIVHLAKLEYEESGSTEDFNDILQYVEEFFAESELPKAAVVYSEKADIAIVTAISFDSPEFMSVSFKVQPVEVNNEDDLLRVLFW